MIIRITWDGVSSLCALAALLLVVAVVLNAAASVIRHRRRCLPRCEDCRFCLPIPTDADSCYHCSERHCAMGRGTDEFYNSYVSVVTVDDFCSEYRPKSGKEKQDG